jgi:peptidoglycan/xylan/chitin deacetylase (PgdA/CDA1 family)
MTEIGDIPRRRWIAKKVSRLAVTGICAATGVAAYVQRRSPGPRVRVLTYHRFGEAGRDPFCIDLAQFDAQMRWLSERGLAVSLEDVRDFALGTKTLPDGACLVSMDDGVCSMLTGALPILVKHRVPAVAFITASLIDTPRFDDLPERFMTTSELRALADGGLAIGSHAFSHRSLGKLPLDEAKHEAKESKAALESMLGRPVWSFAYPFGTHGDFDANTDAALAGAGYTLAFNSQHGPIVQGELSRRPEFASLSRVKIEGGEPLWMFGAICRGAMDPWRVVDANLFALQRVRRDIERA